MTVFATDTILLGRNGEIHRGEEVPESYIDPVGDEVATDFDRLTELGLVSDETPVDEPTAEEVGDDEEQAEEAAVVEEEAKAPPKKAPAKKKPATRSRSKKTPAKK